MNTVVGVYGMMCSGKDTVSEILVAKGYKKVSMSEDVLQPILTTLRVEPNRLNYIKLGKALKEFKKDALAYLSHALMNKGSGNKYIIPNIMTFEEARYFKDCKDIKFILLRVTADQKIRYERGIKRASTKDVTDLKEFRDLDMTNLTSTGLKELMHAGLEDTEITNNSGLEELEKKVNEVILRFSL